MKINSLKYFDDKEKGKSCLIIGGANNFNEFPIKNFKGVIITVGDVILRGKKIFHSNYWLASNEFFPIPEVKSHLNLINSFKKTYFIFSDTNSYGNYRFKSENFLKKKLKINWFAWDHIHLNKKKCKIKKNCCDLIDSQDRSIKDYLKKKFKLSQTLSYPAGTIAIEAIAFAMILGCKKIFFTGIELPLKKKDHLDNYYKDNTKIQKQCDNLFHDAFIEYSRAEYKIKNTFIYFLKYLFVSKFTKFYIFIKDFIKLNINFKKLTIKSAFEEDLKYIKGNLNLIAKIAKVKNIKLYNHSRSSLLNYVKNINQIKLSDLKKYNEKA